MTCICSQMSFTFIYFQNPLKFNSNAAWHPQIKPTTFCHCSLASRICSILVSSRCCCCRICSPSVRCAHLTFAFRFRAICFPIAVRPCLEGTLSGLPPRMFQRLGGHEMVAVESEPNSSALKIGCRLSTARTQRYVMVRYS